MNKKISIIVIAGILFLTAIVWLSIWKNVDKKTSASLEANPSETNTVGSEISSNSANLINLPDSSEPTSLLASKDRYDAPIISYSEDEVKKIVKEAKDPQDVIISASSYKEQIANLCAPLVTKYIYAFPGYKYSIIDSYIRMSALGKKGIEYNEPFIDTLPERLDMNSNLSISIQGKIENNEIDGIESEKEVKFFSRSGDDYIFRFYFDSTNSSCKLTHSTIYKQEVPSDIKKKALSLALADKDFKTKLDSSGFSIYFERWFDDMEKAKEDHHINVETPDNNNEKEMKQLNVFLKKPLKGIVDLQMIAPEDNSGFHETFYSYIDVFNNILFTGDIQKRVYWMN